MQCFYSHFRNDEYVIIDYSSKTCISKACGFLILLLPLRTVYSLIESISCYDIRYVITYYETICDTHRNGYKDYYSEEGLVLGPEIH